MEMNLNKFLDTDPLSACNRRRPGRGLALLMIAALSGCAERGATCSDESTVSVVKKIYQDAMTKVLAAAPDAGAALAQIETATSVELRAIRTVGKDEKIGQVSCEGNLSVRVPADIAKALSTPGHLLNAAVQSLSLTVSGDRLEKEIWYTSQMTDDGKQVRVLAKGAPEMGELVATLAAAGMLKSSAKEATATGPAAPSDASPVPDAKPAVALPSVADTPETLAETRFGPLRIDGEQKVLFKGASLSPEPEAGDRLRIVKKFEIGDRDVVLLEAINGTACPSLLYMATLSASGISATPSFGTCTDERQVSQVGDSVRVSMTGFAGNSQPKAEQDAAANEVHVFVYRNGVVTEVAPPPVSKALATNPSFSCAEKLTPAERLICDTPALAAADAELARLYGVAMAKATDPATLKQRQRDWRHVRDACGDVACMIDAYSKRIDELPR